MATGSATAQLRVVSYNIAQLQGNAIAMQEVLAALHDDDKPGFAVPIAALACQEVRTFDLAPMLNLLNASAPPGATFAAATYTNESRDGTGGAQALFYRTDLLIEIPQGHMDIYSGAGRFADRWFMQLAGYDSPQARFYIYSAHLKADTGNANQQERLLGAQNIRANADALGPNRHIIYLGDFNLYNNTEPAYIHFLSAGAGQAFDPLGTGSWAGAANAIKHSQSPRLLAGSGLVGGGLDDRFDFQLNTSAMIDNAGLARITGLPFIYRSLGNDGQHFDIAINTGNNFYYPGDVPRSNALADALHDASDHCPIVVEYQIPAIMAASMPADFGRVIQDAHFTVDVELANAANVVTAWGADLLHYSAVASLGLGGSASGSIEALAEPLVLAFPLNTSVVGALAGQVALTSTSQAVQNPSIQLNGAGTIVRHANASFSGANDLDELALQFQFQADSGAQPIAVSVHNFGFDSLQALLDIDQLSALSPPFAYLGGAASGIGANPATLHFSFNTDGVSPGNYVANVAISVSDEDLPGETTGSISLTLTVRVDPAELCDADVTGDGAVDVSDLLAVISAWGACPGPPDPCPADTNDDGLVNVTDLLAVINAWGACP